MKLNTILVTAALSVSAAQAANASGWLYEDVQSRAKTAAQQCGATWGDRTPVGEIKGYDKVKDCMAKKGYAPLEKVGQITHVCGWAFTGQRTAVIGDCSGMEG